MTKITVTQARALVIRHTDNRFDFTQINATLFLDFANVVDEAYWWQDRTLNPEKYISEKDLDVTGSTREFATADFNTIEPEECGIFLKDGNGDYTDQALVTTRKGSSTFGFFLKKDTNGDLKTVEFTPTTQSERTYGMRYIPDRTILTKVDLSDDMLVDIQHTDYILNMFLRVIDVWNRDHVMLSLHDPELQDATRNLLQNTNPNPPQSWSSDEGQF